MRLGAPYKVATPLHKEKEKEKWRRVVGLANVKSNGGFDGELMEQGMAFEDSKCEVLCENLRERIRSFSLLLSAHKLTKNLKHPSKGCVGHSPPTAHSTQY